MKKIIWLVLVLLMTFTLTGCNLFGPTEEMKEDPSATEEPIDEESVQEPEDEVEDRTQDPRYAPLENIEGATPDEIPEPGPFARSLKEEMRTIVSKGAENSAVWYSEETTPYLKNLDNGTRIHRTIHHPDVRLIVLVINELMRQNNNLQTITPEEVKAPMTEAFLTLMSEHFAPPGELYHEWFVKAARERGWIAETEDEIIEHIVFGMVDGELRATARIQFTITMIKGVNTRLDLNRPQRERSEYTFSFDREDATWKVMGWRVLAREYLN